MTRLTTCLDAETVAQRAAAQIALQLRRAYEERGVAHLALSGGTTPGRTYELLGATPDALTGVEVWFADERCVPPQDEESNYRLVEQTLLAGAGVPAERVRVGQGRVAQGRRVACRAVSLPACGRPCRPVLLQRRARSARGQAVQVGRAARR